MRSAASRPEISTIGTPTPGVVPEPAKTTFSPQMFRGRNGPVCPKRVGRGERRPALHPSRLPVQGRRHRLDLDASPKPTYPRRSRVRHDLVAVAGGEPAPVQVGVEVRGGEQDVVALPAGGRERRVARGWGWSPGTTGRPSAGPRRSGRGRLRPTAGPKCRLWCAIWLYVGRPTRQQQEARRRVREPAHRPGSRPSRSRGRPGGPG
jgi:hypothetical protein